MQSGPGDTLVGKELGGYQIRRRIGKGGMGSVYLAYETTLERFVAIKVLLPALAQDPALVERFNREAKAAAKLSHPNIVQVFAVGSVDGLAYIAMEYVEGIPLDKLLVNDGPLPWQRALFIVGQVASALECAHAKGIVHRDIKPANILIDRQGRARVTDFGVAKLLESDSKLTTSSVFVGTPLYMSPEQCGVGEVGPASDLFSLGVTAYEMLTGIPPFKGDTPASLIRKITLESPKPLAESTVGVPESVQGFVGQLLEKDVARRIQTARGVLDVLRSLQDSMAAPALATTPAGVRAPTKGKNVLPVRYVAVAAVAIALVAAIAVGIVNRRNGTASAETSNATTVGAADEAGAVRHPIARDLFIRTDANGDGKLSVSEIPAMSRMRIMQADRDGDRFVTKEELEQRFGPPGVGLAQPGRAKLDGAPGELPDIDEMIKKNDKNGDGALSLREVPLKMAPNFRQADSNSNGIVTREEMSEARDRLAGEAN